MDEFQSCTYQGPSCPDETSDRGTIFRSTFYASPSGGVGLYDGYGTSGSECDERSDHIFGSDGGKDAGRSVCRTPTPRPGKPDRFGESDTPSSQFYETVDPHSLSVGHDGDHSSWKESNEWFDDWLKRCQAIKIHSSRPKPSSSVGQAQPDKVDEEEEVEFSHESEVSDSEEASTTYSYEESDDDETGSFHIVEE